GGLLSHSYAANAEHTLAFQPRRPVGDHAPYNLCAQRRLLFPPGQLVELLLVRRFRRRSVRLFTCRGPSPRREGSRSTCAWSLSHLQRRARLVCHWDADLTGLPAQIACTDADA